MSVTLKFESNQQFQLDAVEAVCGIFEGTVPDERIDESSSEEIDGELFSHKTYGNRIKFLPDVISQKIAQVQSRTRLNSEGIETRIIPENRVTVLEPNQVPTDFNIEMETGTGKTYVYLKTAFELHRRFGVSKFVVVVPSVAIREGVEASIKAMKPHFKDIFGGLQFDHFVYNSKQAARLRQFADSKHLQILIINIQAFDKDSTIIQRSLDDLQGKKPVDFITSTRPVVIMDEPQKLSSKLQGEAIEKLNPLVKLRYSATHRADHCLLYRLGPVDAYDMGLVKQIEVLAMKADEDTSSAYVELLKVHVSNDQRPTATLSVNKDGTRVRKAVKSGDSLSTITGSTAYKGWDVEDIRGSVSGESPHVQFGNGRSLYVTENTEIEKDWWQRAQIESTIRAHFDTELKLAAAEAYKVIKAIKPLTLFFIDRVANYHPEDGKFRMWFDEIYTSVKLDRKYRSLEMPSAGQVKASYFASAKGEPKDSDGDSLEDAVAYDWIMRDKETLLSPENPVRFIFSHTALSEGWDNPNVFTICNLQEVNSEIRKRQQIGRGLRLPVMVDGTRCRNSQINILTVVASESFEDFAAKLQIEMFEDTKEEFTNRIHPKRDRKTLELDSTWFQSQILRNLWDAVSPRTLYHVEFKAEDFSGEAVLRLKQYGVDDPISDPVILLARAQISMTRNDGVQATSVRSQQILDYTPKLKATDILTDLQEKLPISRSAILQVINESQRKVDLQKNPEKFKRQVKKAIDFALANTLVNLNAINYSKVDGPESNWPLAKLSELPTAYSDNMVATSKSIYGHVVVDSDIERDFAIDLNSRRDVLFFLKFPDWFKIETPLGGYNPDWAVVQESPNGAAILHLVRETKGSLDLDSLRFDTEKWKIVFGFKHFETLGVDYSVVVKASDLNNGTIPKFEN